MQFKNLNDLLAADVWPVPGQFGGSLRMYMLATLAHPKGWNIRNDVAHGLWPSEGFHIVSGQRVLHVLLAVALVRPIREPQSRTDEELGPDESTAAASHPTRSLG